MKKVLVVGGSGTIGSALVDFFSSSGYEVTSTYHSIKDKKVESKNICKEVYLDLGSKDLLGQFLSPEGFEIIILAAGVLKQDFLGKIKDEDIYESLEVNLVSNIKLCNYFLPLMLDNGFGRIIIFGSTVSDQGVAGGSVYASSKAGLKGLLYSASREIKLRKDRYNLVADVTINIIEPGPIMGNMLSRLNENILQSYIDNSPTKNLTQVNELVSVVNLLVQPESGINGSVIKVDGGLVM